MEELRNTEDRMRQEANRMADMQHEARMNNDFERLRKLQEAENKLRTLANDLADMNLDSH